MEENFENVPKVLEWPHVVLNILVWVFVGTMSIYLFMKMSDIEKMKSQIKTSDQKSNKTCIGSSCSKE